MKTKNNTRETIDNQVHRMVLRGSAVILSLALISLTVNAQDLWKQFSNTRAYEKMAMLTVGQSSEIKEADVLFEIIDAEVSIKLKHSSTIFALETEQEVEMQLEAWMTNESNFISTINFNSIETEEALRVEDWMINNPYFENQLNSESVDIEKPMEIESWMTMDDYFTPAEGLSSEEPALKIESWMLDNKIFSSNLIVKETIENEPMHLETWMTNNHYWAF